MDEAFLLGNGGGERPGSDWVQGESAKGATMRERKISLFHCPYVDHNVRVMYLNQLDHWRRRPVYQSIQHCSYRTEQLCKVELYPQEGESQCPAVQLAQRNQFR